MMHEEIKDITSRLRSTYSLGDMLRSKPTMVLHTDHDTPPSQPPNYVG